MDYGGPGAIWQRVLCGPAVAAAGALAAGAAGANTGAGCFAGATNR
ncbi:hypothetical protein H7J50_05270 [Mycobacterium intermedium]|nr:hypothetical protein [Mycobacterium intermedium]MCV6963220.1 hypothetical protein [Mycobacterium intermedium]